jgi:DNA polymerase-3 subunit alpha (Gram-positive type)
MTPYVVVDIETTGTQPLKNDIIEIGAVYVQDGQVTKQFSKLVCPVEEISPYITEITGITSDMVKDKPPIEEVLPEFLAFCEDAFLVGHNLFIFDYRMLKVKAAVMGIRLEKKGLDTLVIARKCLAHLPSRKLGDLCRYYGIELVQAHRAYADAYATYELFEALKRDFGYQDEKLFIPQLIEWEVPKKSPITPRQKNYLLKLCAYHGLTLEKPIEIYSKSEASRQIDIILREYGNR